MKVSWKQLDKAMTKMKYSLLGYGAGNDDDLELSVELITADPGSGVMVDCMLLKAHGPIKEGKTKEVSMTVEIFPCHENQEPRASIIESFTIKDKY